ncbi:MAG: M23 family metallopeptidase [Alphaproteobacteria bacterium]|nr:M23 family metallopeptidase [Alphaproteobacteria bacterium]
MNLKNTLQKTSDRIRLARLKEHLKKRQSSIALLLMFAICAGSFPFLMRCSVPQVQKTEPTPEIEEQLEQAPLPEEIVHEDLGDEPVVKEAHVSLNELEQRVQLGELKMKMTQLDKGESVLTLLSREDVPTSERVQIVDGLELLINLRTLRPGMQFIFFKDGPDVVGVSLMTKDGETLAVLREADGSWTPFSHTGRVETKTIRWQGTVETNFSKAAQKQDIPESLISQVTNALDGEIDFSSDIQKGTEFDIIAEFKQTEGGLEIGAKQLLFVGLKSSSLQINRYAYTAQDGTTAFYNARGKSIGKQLLKRPLKAKARLSSAYGKRKHPILKYEIFHKGVDLAAPKNTPVMAAADGVITSIGRKGSYGKYISIRHADGYQTAYAHLNGYRADLKVKSKVKRGEVIGYVGSTGRSTGPHLHFEVIKNKKVVNPFGNNKTADHQLKGFDLEQFQFWAETVHPDFKQHLAGKIPPVPGPKPF